MGGLNLPDLQQKVYNNRMRAFGLIGLLISVFIIVYLATLQFKSFGLLSGGGKNQGLTNQNPIEAANSVKVQADLKALAVKLNVYFSENGSYPSNLNDIDKTGVDISTFAYRLCQSDKVIVAHVSNPLTLILENGKESYTTGDVDC